MNTRRQRQRMPNFSSREENVLRILTMKYQKEIEEKSSNARVWRMKNITWEKIAGEFFNITSMERSALKLKSKYETMKKRKQLDIKIEDDIVLSEQHEKSREHFLQKLEDELQKSKKDFELRPATIAFVDQPKKGEESQGEEKTEEKESSKKEIVVKPLSTLLEPNLKVNVEPKAIVERARRLNVKPQPMSLENPRKRRKLNTQLELKSPKIEAAAPKANGSLLEVHLDMADEQGNAKLEIDPLSALREDSTIPEADNQDNEADADESNLETNEEPEFKIEISNLAIVPSKSENNNYNNSPNQESVETKCQSTQIDSKLEEGAAENLAQIEDAERSVCRCSSMELSTMSDHLKAQLGYYRNTELRAQQKHMAELKNLEVQHQILELELKTKQRQYDIMIQS